MNGLLKIYHPDETLKYNISRTYCKAAFSNRQHLLSVEVITNDDLDHVDDDSLQYKFPQISLEINDFPIDSDDLEGKTFEISDTQDEHYTYVDLFDDEEANLYENQLTFSKENGELTLIWKGKIDDFYTNADEPIPFKLKCNFRQDEVEVDD